jgi:hypothetical protein
MWNPITISKLFNLFLLVVGLVSFSFLNENCKYRYYQWAGMKSGWIKKILFKKLIK